MFLLCYQGNEALRILVTNDQQNKRMLTFQAIKTISRYSQYIGRSKMALGVRFARSAPYAIYKC